MSLIRRGQLLSSGTVLTLMAGFAWVTARSLRRSRRALSTQVPKARTGPDTVKIGRHTLRDPYHWMRSDALVQKPGAPLSKAQREIMAYLGQENHYTKNMTTHLLPLQEKLYKNMLKYVNENETHHPYPSGPFVYYRKDTKGLSYPCYFRKARTGGPDQVDADSGAVEETVFDVNALSKGHKFFSIGRWSVSPCHKYVAYTVDLSGYECYTLSFVEIASGMVLSHATVTGKLGRSVVWGRSEGDAGDYTVFFTTVDAAHRTHQVHAMRFSPTPEEEESKETGAQSTDKQKDCEKDGSKTCCSDCGDCKDEDCGPSHDCDVSVTLITEPNPLYSVHMWKDKTGSVLHIESSGIDEGESWVVDLQNDLFTLTHTNPEQPDDDSDAQTTQSDSENAPSVLHSALMSVLPRSSGHLYEIEVYVDSEGKDGDMTSGFVYMLSNHKARNFRILRRSLADLQQANEQGSDASDWTQGWQVVVEHDPDTYLTSVSVSKTHLLLGARRGGFGTLLLGELGAQDTQTGHIPLLEPKFPDRAATVDLSYNHQFDSPFVRVSYTSLTAPETLYGIDTRVLGKDEGKTLLFRHRADVPNYDGSKYRSQVVYVKSRDGSVKIPISLFYRADKVDMTGKPTDGESKSSASSPSAPGPLLLYGYGSYGMCYDPEFDECKVMMADQGLVVGIAHIRGGGECGRAWYENGKYLQKKNTFTDFIDAAEHLCVSGWTVPRRLAISGGSAGGLLMGSVCNMRPDLFRCVLTRVPFVDVMSTMSDASIPLTVGEYQEWGNPHLETYYDYMLSYSPINNVRSDARYPALLITAGLYDPRVHYWEPLKYIATLRARTNNNARAPDVRKFLPESVEKSGGNVYNNDSKTPPMFMKCDTEQGHGGASDRYKWWKERAFMFAFIVDQVLN